MQKINVLEQELQHIRLDVLPGGIDYSKDKIQTTPTNNQMTDYIIRLEELETELYKKRMEFCARLEDILNCINVMTDPEEQAVLIFRYINGFEWEDIAESMNRSKRSVIYIHGDALKHFAVIETIAEKK